MLRKLYFPTICLACLFTVLSFSTVSASTDIEVLLYTGTFTATNQKNISKTYTIPEVVTQLPDNVVVKCIDGIVVLKIGEVQVIMEAEDKLQLASPGKIGKTDIICLSGEIETLWEKDAFKISPGQTMALNSQGAPTAEKTEGDKAPVRIKNARSKLSESPILPSDLDTPEDISPYY
jgi:hypothetical protein